MKKIHTRRETTLDIDKKARLLELLQTYSFMTGEFVLASGRISNYYFDFRASASDPESIKLVGELFFEKIRDYGYHVDAIGGAIFGAAPMVTAVTIESYLRNSPLPGFYVRKEPKKYGTRNYIEGYIDPSRPLNILMIEDVITTGGSILRAAQHLRESIPDCNILGILALLDRLEGGRENIEKAGFDLWTLFTIQELFDAQNGDE